MTAFYIYIFLMVIISFFLSPRRFLRRRGYRRFIASPGMTRYRDDDYYDENLDENRDDDFSRSVKRFLRRRRALKKAAKFLVKKKRILMLKNKYVMVNFDSEKRIIICIDANNMKNSVTANSMTQELKGIRYINSSEANEDFDFFFDQLCYSFNSNSNYAGVSAEIKKNFEVNEKKALKYKKQEQQQQSKQADKKIEQININEATEEQLTNLPGVSVVQAKKTLNRINLKGDFKSVEEFFIEIKIKPNFQKKLRKLVFTSPHKSVEKNDDNDDRIIDL